METDIIQAMSSLGVGAVFGVVVFWVYRIDKKTSEKRLSELLRENMRLQIEHQKVLTELVTLLRGLNGRLTG